MDYNIIKKVNARFISGNSISIDKASLPTTEWNAVMEYVDYLENLADDSMETCNRQAFIIDCLLSELAFFSNQTKEELVEKYLPKVNTVWTGT